MKNVKFNLIYDKEYFRKFLKINTLHKYNTIKVGLLGYHLFDF